MAPQTKAPPTTAPKSKGFTPKPPRPVEERLPRLYRSLSDQINEGYFENAVKTCKKILNLDAASETAFQTLLFLYLQIDEYSAALKLIEDSKKPHPFERAYCLYRLHRESEALTALEGLEEEGKKVEHLRAQIYYRMGEWEKTQEIYESLLDEVDAHSPEHPDILANIAATSKRHEFDSHDYRSHLANVGSSSQVQVPAAEIESYVPSLPTGWATAGGLAATVEKKTAAVKAPGEKLERSKPKHKLPKGAVAGKPVAEDPERWIPLRQRLSYINAQSKKKGVKESMGTGFTQGSTAQSSGGGGGAKNKKGKKK
ncbi:hypothetical protein, variant 1 [Cryptococcus amylolentus CBS 6039]|uniref:Signal recognition particle subunit SRP72 n=2 Tax=Cryptococcus amylolentus TaxID=104669 RepID=A0A1E3I812_9TREE|nr:hypothetical protein L202_00618 [Cryptococcus amylolentus CBS 6039]XP_018998538.1 hypothetical protein, variant 1 [Cryptococcus amylolentus CBS 6039]ODN84734.1 hypothetical protein L202_00618 [Cryptococcus amylolentus CBS 6039]ODN84735.1 hypothetical protein, variant 1 [Cryptococcus amylolentus CBS 6039]ODO11528.1 hypothetical protein I350_00308 [Cryptococcus amylolentus CBS 6273]